jgi:hypothetical protein
LKGMNAQGKGLSAEATLSSSRRRSRSEPRPSLGPSACVARGAGGEG